jgi:hypothetical protein
MADSIQLISSLITPLVLMLIFTVGYRILLRYLRNRDKYLDMEYELKRFEVEAKRSQTSSATPEGPKFDPSGYIIINLSESQKSLFLDLLKGFEEYAALKGYKISFSYDGSMPNRVAFKFTIIEGGISVSTEKVRQDLNDYIKKVKNGESFDDIEIVVPPEQHHIVLMILKNRLAFLQQTYSTQQNALQLYESLIKTFGSGFSHPTAQFYIQGSGTQDASRYSTINSQQIAQGRNIRLIDTTALQSINIGCTFNDRKAIVEAIDYLISQLQSEMGDSKNAASEAMRLFSKTKDELTEEEQPDNSRIKRYLERAKQIFSTASFAKEAVDAFKELLRIFNLS